MIKRSTGRVKEFFNRWLQFLWQKAATPKLWTLAMVATYISLVVGWIPAIINPPNSLSGVWGIATMYVIAFTIVVGSIFGMFSAFFGVFRVEVWAVLTAGAGILMYFGVVHGLHWFTEGSGNRLPQAQTIGALLPTFIARFVWVTRQHHADDEELLLPNSAAD